MNEVLFKKQVLSHFDGILQNETGIEFQNIRKLPPFLNTHICDSGFLRYYVTKTEYRNMLDAVANLRL
jgi:hypothetical protein